MPNSHIVSHPFSFGLLASHLDWIVFDLFRANFKFYFSSDVLCLSQHKFVVKVFFWFKKHAILGFP
jgi:hypothetical protein